MTRAQKDLLLFMAARMKDDMVSMNSGWLQYFYELIHNVETEVEE